MGMRKYLWNEGFLMEIHKEYFLEELGQEWIKEGEWGKKKVIQYLLATTLCN